MYVLNKFSYDYTTIRPEFIGHESIGKIIFPENTRYIIKYYYIKHYKIFINLQLI
jgi:hypothetical protein